MDFDPRDRDDDAREVDMPWVPFGSNPFLNRSNISATVPRVKHRALSCLLICDTVASPWGTLRVVPVEEFHG
jgi:hypothetical protein